MFFNVFSPYGKIRGGGVLIKTGFNGNSIEMDRCV
jgi:hypothetical protein